MKVFLKILLWIAIIGLVIFLTLFIAARIAEFDSIGDLLKYIVRQF